MSNLKILTLASIKGGVGKTVASVNIAGCISNRHPEMDVILLDLDPQGNSSMYLGYDASNIEQGTFDLFDGDYEIEDCLCDTSINNLKIIPCEISLRNIQLRISLGEINIENPNEILRNKINHFREKIKRDTIIIIDTHPDFDLFTVNALICSDRVICPINPCEFSIYGFTLLFNNTNYIREKLNKKLRIMGLFKNNWSKTNTKTVKGIDEKLELGEFHKFLMNTSIPATIDVEKSKNENLPLIYSSSKNKEISKNYLSLSDEILNKWEEIIR